MCTLCRIVGKNVFADVETDHDVDSEDEIVIATDVEPWYVWRRSDGFAGASNLPPEEIFDDTYRYYTLGVVGHPAVAESLVLMAINCN